MTGIIAVNGIVHKSSEACISALDRGFLFGDNVFEVFVCFNDIVLDIPQHLQRLRSSAEALKIEVPWKDEELSFELTALAKQLNQKKGYLRLVVTRGEGIGIAIPPDCRPNKIVYAFPAQEPPAEYYTKGIKLKLKHSQSSFRGEMSKTGNYLSSIVAMQDALNSGFHDILWCNALGEITEASTANIFFIGREGDDVLIQTPSTYSGILKGITRTTILSILEEAGIRCTQEVISHEELPKYDEAFVCSTVKGLIPIQQIEGHKLHTCRKNSVFNQISRLYQAQLSQKLDLKGSPSQMS